MAGVHGCGHSLFKRAITGAGYFVYWSLTAVPLGLNASSAFAGPKCLVMVLRPKSTTCLL
jgi:hypothetical protein